MDKIKVSVNNFDIFPREFRQDEFYFLQVIIRGKDHPGKSGVNGSNHARTIRSYSIYNQEQLDKYKPEIIEICNMYGARAYMRPARRNKRKIAAMMIQMLGEFLYKDVHSLSGLYDSAIGKDTGTERLWIVDYDDKSFGELQRIVNAINSIEPKNTVQYVLATVSGSHIISKPFNTVQFIKEYPQYTGLDIHKNNPTLLYYNNII